MAREVNLRLASLLEGHGADVDMVELAGQLGISAATLAAYHKNRWTVLDRTVLERLADYFQCEVTDLLETHESSFFSAFRCADAGTEGEPARCIHLLRPDARSNHGRGSLAHRDRRAIELTERLLLDSVDALQCEEQSATDLPQFQRLLSQNCVAVGSPMVNPASELAICHAFGVPAFDPKRSGDLPFTFRVAGAATRASSVVVPATSEDQGIWLAAEEELLPVDHWPREEFKQRRIGRGRDCGLVFVMNHRSTAGQEARKLIVLAGFTGVGTECAARALVDHYRDFEPREGPDYVWGVFEVFYYKPQHTTSRQILNYNWRRRAGGRCPIAWSKRKT